MRIAIVVAGILLILSPAVAQDEVESLKRVRAALSEGDHAAAASELGFPVTVDTADAVGTAVAERIQVLEDSAKFRTRAEGLPDPDDLRRREGRAAFSLEHLDAGPERKLTKDITEDELTTLRSRAEARSAEDAELRERLRDRKDHLQEVTREAGEIESELESVTGLLDSMGSGETEPLIDFRKETLRRRIQLLREMQAYATRAPAIIRQQIGTLGKEAELSLQKLLRAQAALGAAEGAFNQRRDRQAEEAERLLEETKETLSGIQDPIERFERETAAEAYRIRAAFLRASMTLDEVRRDRAREEKNQARYLENFERITSWFRSRSRDSEKDGRFLLSKLKRVQERKSELRRRLLPQLKEAQELYIFEQAEAQTLLWNLETPVEDEPDLLLELRKGVPQEQRDAADAAFAGRAKTLHAPLEAYTEVLNEIVRELEITSALYMEQSELVLEAEAFIVSRMLWVRNELPLGGAFFGHVADEVGALLRSYSSPALRTAVRERYRGNRWHFGLGFGIFLVLAAAGTLLTRRLARIQSERVYRGGPLVAFAQRLIVLVVISGIGPACLAAAGLMLPLLGLPDALGRPASRALIYLAQVMFFWRIALRLFREEGIAVKRLGMSPDVARQLTRATRLAAVGTVLFLLPPEVLRAEPHHLLHLPRLLDLVALLWFAPLVLALLRRKKPLMLAVAGKSRFWARSAGLLWLLLAISLAVLIAMSALGYEYGAGFLLSNVLKTLTAVVGLTALYRLLTSAVHQTAKRSAIYRRDAAEEAVRQVSRLYGFAGIAVVAVLLASYWDLGDLVRKLLAGVRLATVDDESAVFLTLWDILIAVFWVVGGHIVARNLSGLFELFLFPRMERSDTGTRYVINTVSRYAVILVAYSAAILSLHFNFSSLGWLLAAASVGIGFGLQEIISNFISGLILFFEQPVRVGDVVTVGETTGTVGKIAIRATHVTNFDRQVIILPNRRLIVDDVTNWSLNDRLIRSHVRVGVAYGTDVDRVARLLEDIAKNHPMVRSFPPPEILFGAFGDSSLDMELRVFVDITDRQVAVSELNKLIARRFAEEGIEIPFPQRDLHLKSAPDPTVLEGLAEEAPPAVNGAPELESEPPDEGPRK